MENKVKYLVMFVSNGITKEFKFSKDQKAEAIAAFKNIRMRAGTQRIKLFSIDSDDEDIWYDLSKNY